MAHPDLLGIVVREMPEALRFYRMLGLDIPASADGKDQVEVTLPGGFRLAWYRLDIVKSLSPGWVEPVGQRMGLVFRCASAAEVDAQYAMLVAAGFRGRKATWDAGWSPRYAEIEDPDGNVVDLYARL